MEVTDLERVGGMQRREIQSTNDVSIGIKGFSFLDSIYLNVICQLTLSLYSSGHVLSVVCLSYHMLLGDSDRVGSAPVLLC